MEKRTLIIAASFAGISLIMFFLMAAVIKNFFAGRKKVLIYVAATLTAFSLIALLGYRGLTTDPNIRILFFQSGLFGLGLIHAWALYYYMDWDEVQSVLPDMIFSLFIWIAGLIPFYLIYSLLSATGDYQYHMLGASLLFIVPVFYRKTFMAALAMPFPEMEQWFYPTHTNVPGPAVHELQDPLVITFVIRKKADDSDPVSFRAKAPAEMSLSRLFYYFVEDYNDQHPEHILEYIDPMGRPYGWIFYFKPAWYHPFGKRYADPAKSIQENKIRENTVIVCERADVLDAAVKALEGEVSSY